MIDTKWVHTCLTGAADSDSSLGDLYKSVVQDPAAAAAAAAASASAADADATTDAAAPRRSWPIRFPAGFDRYGAGTGQFHDAGWDAYCTGAVFWHQMKQVGSTEAMLAQVRVCVCVCVCV